MKRRGYSTIYKWIGLTLLTGFVFTGALPERTKAEPVIYPVIPFTGEYVPVRTKTSDSLVERIGRRVKLELHSAAREINEQRRNGKAPASDRSGDLGAVDAVIEGNVLPAENVLDGGEYFEMAEADCGQEVTYLGAWTATAYCSCVSCTTDGNGYTASGTLATEGRTIACNALPMGTEVMIDNHVYIVEDTGWTPFGDAWVDIYFDSHDAALAFGVRTVDVYLIG